MSGAEELARKERRRCLIERLNETEKLIGPQPRGPTGRPDERGGAGSRDREAEGAERCPARWILVLLGFSLPIHPSAWKRVARPNTPFANRVARARAHIESVTSPWSTYGVKPSGVDGSPAATAHTPRALRRQG